MRPVVKNQLAERQHVKNGRPGVIKPDSRIVADKKIQMFGFLNQQAVGREIGGLDIVHVDQMPIDHQQRERNDEENQRIKSAGTACEPIPDLLIFI